MSKFKEQAVTTSPGEASPFRVQGRWATKHLFLETYLDTLYPDVSTVVYTLGEEDKDGYPSLKKLYLQMNDLTEYKFATTHLGGWNHWQQLVGTEWFREHVMQWRTELELKNISEALIRIRDEAEMDGRNAFQANRFLATRGWIASEDKQERRGRPSKSEIKKAAEEQALKQTKPLADLKRLEELLN